MSEAEKRRNKEHKEINSEVKLKPKVTSTSMFNFPFYKIGIELAPLIMDKVTGKPKRDPSTGYMMNHSLGTTDVTQLAINQG